MNLSEPEVRVQQDSYSIGVDMPGVTNSSDVLRKLKDTVTVEYRIVNGPKTNEVNRNRRCDRPLSVGLSKETVLRKADAENDALS